MKFEIKSQFNEPDIMVSDLEVVIRCSDSPSSIQMSLEKLSLKMLSLGIRELALKDNDIVFKTVEIKQFKNIYNKLERRKGENLRILL